MRKTKGSQERKRGFTLIELIIVIAILAILAMIGLPMYGQYRADAEKRTASSNCTVIGRAVEAYIAKTGGATPTASDLEPYLNNTAKEALDSGDYTYAVVDGDVTVTGPDGAHYPGD